MLSEKVTFIFHVVNLLAIVYETETDPVVIFISNTSAKCHGVDRVRCKQANHFCIFGQISQ